MAEDSRKALEAAYALLSGRGGSLGVIILAEDLEKARLLQQEVSQWLQSRGLAARFRWLVDFNPARLAALVNSERYGALVLPADIQALSGPALEAFLDDSEISVYVVH